MGRNDRAYGAIARQTLSMAFISVLATLLIPCVAFGSWPERCDSDGPSPTVLTTTSVALQSTSSSKYRIVFMANGGKGAMKPQTVKCDKKSALKTNAFTRSGYKFAGWNTKANGKGKTYKNKAKVKSLAAAGKTVKLYAQWKKASRTLSLKKAKKAYSTVLKSLKAKHYWVGYKYVDVIGDNTVELVAWTYPPNVGMYKHDYVYTIKSGKPKLVLDNEFVVCENNSVTYRKTAKSLIYYKSHQVGRSGSECSYCYLKYSGGKYVVVAWKSRSWNASEWSYWIPKRESSAHVPYTNASGVSISEAAFNKRVKELVAGNGETMDLSWGTMAKIKNEANRHTGL